MKFEFLYHDESSTFIYVLSLSNNNRYFQLDDGNLTWFIESYFLNNLYTEKQGWIKL